MSYQVIGRNKAAPFTLKIHRGEGMALLAMNWRSGPPPADFIGFAVEYREPGQDRYFALHNRIGFPRADGKVRASSLSTRLSPLQMFRWVHVPRNAELPGAFAYRVTPVFMNAHDELSYGIPQEAEIALRRETYPGQLNVAFTRGFVSSQAFVDRYCKGADGLDTLIPASSEGGLGFVPAHPKAAEALAWMGFEARSTIIELLDEALRDPTAKVCVVAYDICEPDLVRRLEALGPRLRIVIDDSASHAKAESAESQVAARLRLSAGEAKVKRHHLGGLQHNKTIVVDGEQVKAAVCGSTNFSWRGLYVQSNNAILVRGAAAIAPFLAAFEAYWASDKAADFAAAPPAGWQTLGLEGIDARVTFSPHASSAGCLDAIAADIAKTRSSLFYSLAFLYQTPGAVQDAITRLTSRPDRFVYGISDRAVKGRLAGIDLQRPGGNIAPVHAAALSGNVPEPFKSEPTGLAGNWGTRMHHKFVVIDFDKPSARVYMGSYNFSVAADSANGENLLCIRDRRIATSYMIEALRIFDHYHFRVVQQRARAARRALQLARPPRAPGEQAWWAPYYSDPLKRRDRELFA